MATTTTTALGDAVAAEIVSAKLVETAYAAIIAAPKLAHDTLSGSLTKSYVKLTSVTAAALTEGTDGTTTTLADTQVSGTLAEIGIGVALTDLLQVGSSVPELVKQVTRILGLGYAKKVEADIFAQVASLTDVVTATGAPLTEDMFLQASYEIESNDFIGVGQAALLYPKQAHNLSAAIGGTTENQSAVMQRMDILSRMGPALANGLKYSVYGVDVFISTNVVAINTNADSDGCIIVMGDQAPMVRTCGLLDGSMWDGRVELQRDASLRALEIWMTGAQFVVTHNPDAGCELVSVR